jgi:flagellar hook-associated protein 3 FlgL
MIRSFGSYNERFLLDLQRIEARAQRAQTQISSGFKINTPSDAPDQVVGIIQLQLEIARAAQAKTNLQRVQTEVNNNEAALGTAVQLLQDVIVAGAQGVDDSATPEERSVLATRVREWHSELVRLANLNYNGRYQFAGDLDQSAPYEVDWSQPGGVVWLHNAPNTRLIEDAEGNRFSVSTRAQDIFDVRDAADVVAPGNVFSALYELATALEGGDTDAMSTALQSVREAFDHVNQHQAIYGTAQNRIDEAIDRASKKEVREKAELAKRRDADLPAAILELAQSKTNLEAALGAKSNVPRTSLFDYLG